MKQDQRQLDHSGSKAAMLLCVLIGLGGWIGVLVLPDGQLRIASVVVGVCFLAFPLILGAIRPVVSRAQLSREAVMQIVRHDPDFEF
jgi:hypothetical protein